MNLRDETSPLEAATKPVGVLQAASRWSVTGHDVGEPARNRHASNGQLRAHTSKLGVVDFLLTLDQGSTD
jgi:hypothetical protein